MTRRISLFLGVLASIAPFAVAQEADRPFIPLQFQFAPPGARALGMGASFVAIADDATASESNPAGLTILTKPEISAHVRSSQFSVEFFDPFGASQDPVEFTANTTSPAFASIVYPFKSAAVSLYYQQVTRFKQSATFDGFSDGTRLTFTNAADLLVDTIGLSAAYKVTPQLSLGASVRSSRVRFANTGGDLTLSEPGFSVRGRDDISDSSRTITFNAGVLVNPNGKVSAGAFYKQGGKFELTQTDDLFLNNNLLSTDTRGFDFEVPSYFGGGVAFRPNDRLLLSAEVARIQYSVLDPRGQAFEPIDDATEFHAGAEYTLLMGQMPISLRAGAFTDPDHDGLGLDSDQVHVTAGFGFVAQNRFQVDVAANIAKRVKEGLVSLVYRFD